jgi:hypothetical protein
MLLLHAQASTDVLYSLGFRLIYPTQYNVGFFPIDSEEHIKVIKTDNHANGQAISMKTYHFVVFSSKLTVLLVES